MKLTDIVFYNNGKGPRDGNNYWRKVTGPHYVYIGVMLVLMGAGIGLVSFVTGASCVGYPFWKTLTLCLKSPELLVLNLLPCILLLAFFYFATGRTAIAFPVTAAIVYILTMVDYYKIQIRGEVLVLADFTFLNEAAGVLHGYELEINRYVLLVLGTFLFGTLYAVFLMKGALRNVWVRVGGAVASLAVLLGMVFGVYWTEGDARWQDVNEVSAQGFMNTFLRSVHTAFPSPPEGYSAREAQKLLDSFPEGSIPEDKQVNIIAVMLEAYSDLSAVPQLTVYPEVYGPLDALRAEGMSGRLISNTMGGGTVGTERAFLTGNSEFVEYNGPTNSYVWYLREQGYQTEGIHPNYAWNYKRKNVDEYLGFQHYEFREDFGDDWSDEFFFGKILELYEGRDKSKPYFSFSVSLQNHGGYNSYSTGETAYLSREGLSDEDYCILNNYLTGIADTTQRMKDLADLMRDREEPVILVFFGDHMPALGYAPNHIGMNMNWNTEEGFYNFYTVPYLVWANDAAKRVTGGSFSGDGGTMSACFLMDRIFTECGWGKPSYMQLQHETAQRVSIVHLNGWICADGVLTREPEGEPAELLRKMRMAEYYRRQHFWYGELYG